MSDLAKSPPETSGLATAPVVVEVAPVHARLDIAVQIRNVEVATGAPDDGRPRIDQLATELRGNLIQVRLVPLQIAERDRATEKTACRNCSVDLVTGGVRVATLLARIEPELDLARIADARCLEIRRQVLARPVGVLDGGIDTDGKTVAERTEDAMHRAVRECDLIGVAAQSNVAPQSGSLSSLVIAHEVTHEDLLFV